MSKNWINVILDAISSFATSNYLKTFDSQITPAANAGQVDIASVSTGDIIIQTVILRSNGTTTGDFTSAEITGGTNLNPDRVTFIPAVLGDASNLDLECRQVSWEGEIKLKSTDKLVINLSGSGATTVDFDITIEYKIVDSSVGGDLS